MDLKPLPSQQRRQAVRALRPLLRSTRLVNLFLQIGMLAVTKPAAIRLLELEIARLSTSRQARAELAPPAAAKHAG